MSYVEKLEVTHLTVTWPLTHSTKQALFRAGPMAELCQGRSTAKRQASFLGAVVLTWLLLMAAGLSKADDEETAGGMALAQSRADLRATLSDKDKPRLASSPGEFDLSQTDEAKKEALGGTTPGLLSRRLIVKYQSRGTNALVACADRLSSRGAPFASYTADHSSSLDLLHQKLRLGRHRAVFRRPEGQSFVADRKRLTARHTRMVQKRGRLPGRQKRPSQVLPDLSHIYRVEVPAGVSMVEAVASLREDPHVEYAQADYALSLDQAVSFNDPFLTSSGSWGQPYADLWGLQQVAAPLVWDLTQGEGIVVAVVDTGLDRFHPDIEANVWVNPGEDLDGDGRATPADENGLDDDENGFIDDLTGFDFADSVDADQDGFYDGPDDVSDHEPFDLAGHGTHVSGTIAAVAGNGIGVVGVAPRAKIMALRGFPEGRSANASSLWRAVLYAAENGASVVNNSWSCSGACPENPLADDVLALVDALDTVVVTSAGNASQDVVFRSPENGPGVVTVGAVGATELPASFSNRGWGIDVMAPGGGPNTPRTVRAARTNVLSLLTSALDPDEQPFSLGGDYWRLAGTSMSSPHVAGAVALLRSLRPELTPSNVRRLLRLSGRDAGLPGHDPVYGPGLLDIPALLSAVLPDLDLRIDSPRPVSVHDPLEGPIVVMGRAEGEDLVSVEIAFASGISGRRFETITEFDPDTQPRSTEAFDDSTEPSSSRVLARWDVIDVADGPYVLRVRGLLNDGRVVDEYLVVSVERNAPTRISAGELDVGIPDLSGGRVIWPVAESSEAGADFDLALGRLPAKRAVKSDNRDPLSGGEESSSEPRMRLLVEEEGSQGDVSMARKLVAWRVREAGEATLEWCRLKSARASRRACRPNRISLAAGTPGAPHVGQNWIVWQRDTTEQSMIEGCRVARRSATCRPFNLIDDVLDRSWKLRSFDGQTLLIEWGRVHALCRLSPSGMPCQPELIVRGAGTPLMFEPLHDGRLFAFSEVTIESRPPRGCLPGEFVAGCRPAGAVVVRYHACLLPKDTNVCDSIPISESRRVEYFSGIEVSGRRIAWAAASATEESTVRVCEFDRSTQACPAQRLTGSAARQDGIAMDGRRIVWRDRRPGELSVWGTELITLKGPERKRKRAGSRFSIPFRVWSKADESITYSVESVLGLEPELAGAKIVDPGPSGGRVRLVGRIPKNAEGLLRWRVRAEGQGGLYSEWLIEVEVSPPPNAWGQTKDWTRLWPK